MLSTEMLSSMMLSTEILRSAVMAQGSCLVPIIVRPLAGVRNILRRPEAG